MKIKQYIATLLNNLSNKLYPVENKQFIHKLEINKYNPKQISRKRTLSSNEIKRSKVNYNNAINTAKDELRQQLANEIFKYIHVTEERYLYSDNITLTAEIKILEEDRSIDTNVYYNSDIAHCNSYKDGNFCILRNNCLRYQLHKNATDGSKPLTPYLPYVENKFNKDTGKCSNIIEIT